MDSNVKESARADDPFLRVLETYVQMGLEVDLPSHFWQLWAVWCRESVLVEILHASDIKYQISDIRHMNRT
jgi:hypothetical protein